MSKSVPIVANIVAAATSRVHRNRPALAAAMGLAVLLAWSAAAPADIIVTTFDQVSPTPTVYVENTDFRRFGSNFALGDVTGQLQSVPDFGDEAVDFVAFTPGNIALIERGGFGYFSTKVINATSAGAIGVIIYDSAFGTFPPSTLTDPTTIPSVFITHNLGLNLVAQSQTTPTTMHIAIESVPEPASGAVALIGALAMIARRRR